MPADRDQDLSGRKDGIIFGVNFELVFLKLADTADFDAGFVFKFSVSNLLLDDLDEVITIKISVDIQFANVGNRLRLGVNFLA